MSYLIETLNMKLILHRTTIILSTDKFSPAMWSWLQGSDPPTLPVWTLARSGSQSHSADHLALHSWVPLSQILDLAFLRSLCYNWTASLTTKTTLTCLQPTTSSTCNRPWASPALQEAMTVHLVAHQILIPWRRQNRSKMEIALEQQNRKRKTRLWWMWCWLLWMIPCW